MKFNWTPPYNGGSTIKDYILYWDKGLNGVFYQIAFTNYDVTEFTLDYGLTAGKKYKFNLYAQNAVGISLASPISTFTAASVPDIPGKPYSTNTSKTSISLAWTTPNNNGTPITNY